MLRSYVVITCCNQMAIFIVVFPVLAVQYFSKFQNLENVTKFSTAKTKNLTTKIAI